MDNGFVPGGAMFPRGSDELMRAMSAAARRLYGENHEAILKLATRFATVDTASIHRLRAVGIGLATELRHRAVEDMAIANELERLAGENADLPPERL